MTLNSLELAAFALLGGAVLLTLVRLIWKWPVMLGLLGLASIVN